MQSLAQQPVSVYNMERDFYLINRLFIEIIESDLIHPHVVSQHVISKV